MVYDAMHNKDNYEGKICIEPEIHKELWLVSIHLHTGHGLSINRVVPE